MYNEGNAITEYMAQKLPGSCYCYAVNEGIPRICSAFFEVLCEKFFCSEVKVSH